MNIGELEVRSGATRHTLRYYEKIGLISPLRRTNNYRVYTPQTLQDLDFIQRAQSMGFSLGEIGEILNAQRNNSIDCADRKSTRLNSSHLVISYAVFCLKKKMNTLQRPHP